MVEWVREQDLFAEVNIEAMRAALGESWFDDSCPLCAICFNPNDCLGCPLLERGYSCNDENSPWWTVDRGETWCQWLYAAETLMLPALQKTLKIYQKKLKGKSHAHAKHR